MIIKSRDAEDKLQDPRNNLNLNLNPSNTSSHKSRRMNAGHDSTVGENNIFLPQDPEVEVNVSGIIFKANRSDLTTQSHYFKNVLQRDAQTVVYIEGMTPSIFASILRWCQTSEVELNDENFAQVFTAADLLGIPTLVAKCKAHLHQLFLTGNPSTIYEPLRNSCAKSLKQTIRDTFAENFLQIIKKPYFLKLTPKQICSVLSHEALVIHSEIDVFEAAVYWLLHQWFKRRKFTMEVLSCVRFAFITDEDLLDFYEKPEYAAILDLPECQQLIIKGLLYRAATKIHRSVSFTLPTKPRKSSNQRFSVVRVGRAQQKKSDAAGLGTPPTSTSAANIGNRRVVRSVPEINTGACASQRQNIKTPERQKIPNHQCSFLEQRHQLKQDTLNVSSDWSECDESDTDDSMANAKIDKKNLLTSQRVLHTNPNVKSKVIRQEQQLPWGTRGALQRQNRHPGDNAYSTPRCELVTKNSFSDKPLVGRNWKKTTSEVIDKTIVGRSDPKTKSSPRSIDFAVEQYYTQLALSLKQRRDDGKRESDDDMSIVGNTSSMSNSSDPCEQECLDDSRRISKTKDPGSLELVCPSCLVVFRKFSSDHFLVNKSTSPVHPHQRARAKVKSLDVLEMSGRLSDEESAPSSKDTFPESPQITSRDLLFDASSILVLCGMNPKDIATGGKQMFLLNPKDSEGWKLYDNASFPRIHAAVVLYKDCVYVLGGCDPHRSHKTWPLVTSECIPLKTNLRYSLIHRTWSVQASMKVARSLHAGVVFHNSIYVLAGLDERHQLLSSVERYDPERNEWERIGHMKVARLGLSVVVFRGSIWACGGIAYDADTHNRLCTTTVEMYVKEQDMWQVHPCSLRRPRSFAVMIAWSDSMLVMVGGATGIYKGQRHQGLRSCRSIEVFSEVGRRWERRGGMLMKRHSAAAAVYGHYLYVIGGCASVPKDKQQIGALNNVERIDLLSFESHSAQFLPVPLAGLAAIVLPEPSPLPVLGQVSPSRTACSSSS